MKKTKIFMIVICMLSLESSVIIAATCVVPNGITPGIAAGQPWIPGGIPSAIMQNNAGFPFSGGNSIPVTQQPGIPLASMPQGMVQNGNTCPFAGPNGMMGIQPQLPAMIPNVPAYSFPGGTSGIMGGQPPMMERPFSSPGMMPGMHNGYPRLPYGRMPGLSQCCPCANSQHLNINHPPSMVYPGRSNMPPYGMSKKKGRQRNGRSRY